MKNEITNTQLAESIKTFGKYMADGLRCIKEAAREYVAAIDRWPDADIKFAEAFPWITAKDWKLLRGIGRGELAGRVFFIPNDKTVEAVSVFPLHVQEALVGTVETAPVPQKVFSRGRVIEKRIDEMNAAEISAVIDRKAARIRTVEEQIAAATKAEPEPETKRWEIRGGVLCVYGRVNFTAEEVADILKQMR